MRLTPLPTIKEVIKLYKLRAQKHLSQNFLLNPIVNKRFVKAAGALNDCYVCEVGPGPGGITRAILESGITKLITVEKDARFLPSLQLLNEASGGKMQIHHGDVLKFDMSHIFPDHLIKSFDDTCPKIHILGNLPFNVSTPLIIKWLHQICDKQGPWRYGRTRMTLTFQKEVAERIVAPILTDQRCRLSVMAQNWCEVRHKFDIPGKVFLPPPDVDVGVVTFRPKKQPDINQPFKLVEKLVRHTFQYRQKFCKHGLCTLFPPTRPELTTRLFQLSGVSPELRSFMLTMEDFKHLCNAYSLICDEHPEIRDYYFRSQENAPEWRKTRVAINI